MDRRKVIVIFVALALALTPASALASSQDVTSTHTYIKADLALARASEALVAPGQASIVSFDKKLGQECPDAGAGSPENEESQKLSYEATGALWSISYGAAAGPIAKFMRAVAPLRWSNPKLARLAQSYAKSLHELATLPIPPLCSDIRTWSASGFRTVPADTLSLDRHVEAIELHPIPAKLLAAYEPPADKGIIASTKRLEVKLEQTETVVGFKDWDMLLETLGLNQ